MTEYVKTHPLEALVDFHRGARHLDELAFEDLYENSILKECGQTKNSGAVRRRPFANFVRPLAK